MFIENPNLHKMNRRLSKTTKISSAQVSDGTHGVVIYYGDHIMVLNKDEALNIATRIVDTLDQRPSELRVSQP